MMRLRRTLRANVDGGERGIALVMVIGMSAVLAIFVISAISFSIGGLKAARGDENWNGAMAAAYAGVEEYQSRLANDPTYLKYGDPAAAFGAGASPALVLPSDANAAFGLGTAGTWATVNGSGGTSSFRYEVDNRLYASTGTLRVRSTGRVGQETRTIVADLKQQGFIDFMYFTDYEFMDPGLAPSSWNPCVVDYDWAGQSGNCVHITFGSGDVVDGPVHSNDIIQVCKATFKGPVTTAYNPASGLRYKVSGSGCTASPFLVPGSPAYSPKIGMPATNSQLKKETRTDLTAVGIDKPGCLYTGPTSIKFTNDGKMTVRSPWTRFTNTAGEPTASGTNDTAKCGTPGITGLGSATGVVVPVPTNRIIYAQTVPAGSADPNSWGTGKPPRIGGGSGGFKCVSDDSNTEGTGNGIGYPRDDEERPSSTSYECKAGDVFIEGVLKGQVTVAAEKYVYVTGDLTYKDPQEDMLGLVGNEAVWVWNPMDNRDRNLLTDSGREIDAAILSVGHSFGVQNYSDGDQRGILTITGAIAQKFRGIVAQGGGYVKNYVYDTRFKYTAPPKFLSPVTTTYGVNVWVETSPAFDAKGVYR